MAGYIAEFFGYKSEDTSETALQGAAKRFCLFLNSQCTKILSRDRDISGVCAVKQKNRKRSVNYLLSCSPLC
jgi:hypothetical protein